MLILGMALLYALTMFTAYCTRLKLYTRVFMEQFNREHMDNFPEETEAPSLGYPDIGNGRFSA